MLHVQTYGMQDLAGGNAESDAKRLEPSWKEQRQELLKVAQVWCVETYYLTCP